MAMTKKELAEREALLMQVEDLLRTVAEMERHVRLNYVKRTEYDRVQAVLRTTQQFMRKYKSQRSETAVQRAAPAPVANRPEYAGLTRAQIAIREHHRQVSR
jgi:hypothetical protein